MSIPLHLLILEDRSSDAELMLAELRRAGFEPDWKRVETRKDFKAALDPSLDVILADFHLPQFDGARALALLNDSGLDIPLILVSGEVGEETAVGMMKQGAADYILKDRMARLGEAVTHALEDHQLREKEREAEEALRTSELRYQTLAEVSPVGIFRTDLEGQTTYVNPRWCELSGLAAVEALGDGWIKAVYPEDRDVLSTGWRQAAKDQSTSVKEYRFLHPDGTLTWVMGQATPEKDTNGNIVGYIGTITDITDRKHAEKLVHERLELMEYSIAHSLDLVLQKALDIVGELTSSPIGFYHFVSSDQKNLLLQAWSTRTEKEFCKAELKGMHFPIEQAGIWVDCFHARKPVIHNDYASLPHRKGMPEGHALVIRELVVPILRGENVVAILGVGNKPVDYTQADADLVSYFADVAWEIAERMRAEQELEHLYGEAQQHVREVETLTRVGQKLTATLSQEEIIEHLGAEAGNLLRGGNFAVIVGDEGRKEFEIKFYLDRGERKEGAKLTKGRGLTSLIIMQKESILADDYLRECKKRGIKRGGFGEAAKSWLGVPIIARDKALGALLVWDYEREGSFSAWDQQILSTLAAQAAVALENARLFAETNHRANQFSKLYETAQNLTGLMDLQTVLQTSVQQAVSLLGTNNGSLALYDPERGDLVLAAVNNFPAPLGKRRKLGEGMAGIVAQTRQPLYVEDYKTWEHTLPDYDGIQLNAAIEVPMIFHGQLTGTLGVGEVDTKRKFTEADVLLLSLFAAQAASAIQNAQLYTQTEQRLGELKILYESSLGLSGLLDTKAIGQRVLDLMAQELDWQHATIRLYHPEDETMELLAFSQPGITEEAERRTTEERFKAMVARSGQGLSGWVVQHGETVRCGDLSKDERYVDTYPGLRSGLYVPLKVGGQVTGVISVEREQMDAFSASDERLLGTLAAQAAVALENARLFESAHRRAYETASLLEASRTLNTLSLEASLQTIGQKARKLFSADSCRIFLTEADGRTLRCMLALREDEAAFSDLTVKFGEGVTGAVAASGEAEIVNDMQSDPRSVHVAGTPVEEEAIMFAPFKEQERVLGVISVRRVGKDRLFQPVDLELLKAFAALASSSVSNARLFAETRSQLTGLEAVNRISTALRAGQTTEQMLPILMDETLKVMGSEAGVIWLYDPNSGLLKQAAPRGWFTDIHETPVKPGEGIAGAVFTSGEAIISTEFASDPRTRGTSRAQVPVGWGGACVPIRTEKEVIGVLFLAVQAPRQISQVEIGLLTTISEMAGTAIRRATLYEQTDHQVQRLTALRSIDTAIASSFDLRITIDITLKQALNLLHLDAADVLLFNPHANTLEYFSGEGFRTDALRHTRLRLGEGYAGLAGLERKMMHVPNLRHRQTDFLRSPTFSLEGFETCLCVPLIAKGQLKGVLEAYTRTPLAEMDPAWKEFLETLAGQAAIAIDNVSLMEDLQRSNAELFMAYDATIEGWSKALDLRDEETEGHSQRVTEWTVELARALQVESAGLSHIRRGALLHDIGKMGVPDEILRKPGPLTDEEWVVMRRHPQLAYEMLCPIAYLRPALDIPYCHHEKWDGSGYPRGLKGEEIPLAARLFAVVDVYDALTSNRPYRNAWSKAKTLEYIREQSGKHFDPKVVEEFLYIHG